MTALSGLRVFIRNCVYIGQDLKDAFWPGQLVDALREADFAREALNDFEAAHDGLDGYELPDFPGPFPDPFASCVASATEAPSSVDASDRPAGDHPPSPAGHSKTPFLDDDLESRRTETLGCEKCDTWPWVIKFPNGITRYICDEHGLIGHSFTTTE